MTRDPLILLQGFLDNTRPQELDCDEFFELLGPWIDDMIESPSLLALLSHHAELCAECAEELQLLKLALDRKA